MCTPWWYVAMLVSGGTGGSTVFPDFLAKQRDSCIVGPARVARARSSSYSACSGGTPYGSVGASWRSGRGALISAVAGCSVRRAVSRTEGGGGCGAGSGGANGGGGVDPTARVLTAGAVQR